MLAFGSLLLVAGCVGGMGGMVPACAATADAKSGVNCWPQPEVATNVNDEELGKLGLSEAEEWAIVAFLQTLNDGWSAIGR